MWVCIIIEIVRLNLEDCCRRLRWRVRLEEKIVGSRV